MWKHLKMTFISMGMIVSGRPDCYGASCSQESGPAVVERVLLCSQEPDMVSAADVVVLRHCTSGCVKRCSNLST